MNTRHLMGLVATVWMLLPACTSHPPFPPNVMDNVSPTFHFEAWRDASPSNPIVEHPVYGPAEPEKRRAGDYEFAFLYPGELDPQAVKNGNRFVVVGTTSGRRPVVVNGIPKSEPFLVADCIHV